MAQYEVKIEKMPADVVHGEAGFAQWMNSGWELVFVEVAQAFGENDPFPMRRYVWKRIVE